MQIYKFNTILKPVLWGGSKLLEFKHLPACDEPIGESWELSAMPGRESVVAQGEEKGMTLSQLVHHYGAELVGKEVSRRYGVTIRWHDSGTAALARMRCGTSSMPMSMP